MAIRSRSKSRLTIVLVLSAAVIVALALGTSSSRLFKGQFAFSGGQSQAQALPDLLVSLTPRAVRSNPAAPGSTADAFSFNLYAHSGFSIRVNSMYLTGGARTANGSWVSLSDVVNSVSLYADGRKIGSTQIASTGQGADTDIPFYSLPVIVSGGTSSNFVLKAGLKSTAPIGARFWFDIFGLPLPNTGTNGSSEFIHPNNIQAFAETSRQGSFVQVNVDAQGDWRNNDTSLNDEISGRREIQITVQRPFQLRPQFKIF